MRVTLVEPLEVVVASDHFSVPATASLARRTAPSP
jgi:hypothetical protein